jgi:hypothetical protein
VFNVSAADGCNIIITQPDIDNLNNSPDIYGYLNQNVTDVLINFTINGSEQISSSQFLNESYYWVGGDTWEFVINGTYTIYAYAYNDTCNATDTGILRIGYFPPDNVTDTVTDYEAWTTINDLSQSKSITLFVLIFAYIGILCLGLYFKNPAFRVLGCILGVFVGVFILQINYFLGIMVMFGNVIGMAMAAIK